MNQMPTGLHDIFSIIAPFLGLDDLVSLSQVNKELREDVMALAGVLHSLATKPYQIPLSELPWDELYLDSMAGLCWMAQSNVVCVAAAAVGVKPPKKVQPEPYLLITSNTGKLSLSSGLGWSEDKEQWCLKAAPKDKLLGQFYKSWIENTSGKTLGQVKKTLQPTGAAKVVHGLFQNAGFKNAVQNADPSFKVGKQFGTAGNPERYCHAEMKILDLLWSGAVVPLSNVVYIGVSLLCCQHCFKAVRAFNAFCKDYQVVVRGTHGVGYEPASWPAPEFLKANDEIRRAFFAQYTEGRTGFLTTPKPEDEGAERPATF